MNILVNTRLLLPNRLEGIGWFTNELLKRLVKNHPEHTFYFLFDRAYDSQFVYAENVIPVVHGPQARHPFLYLLWFEWAVPKIVKKYKIELFFSPDHFLSLRANVPTVLAIHDLNFMHHPEHFPLIESWYYRTFVPKFARKATRIVAVSEFTKNDIIAHFSVDASKIDVVYNAPNLPVVSLCDEEKDAVRKKYTGGKPYFVYVGSLNRRKNIARLFQAFDKFIDEQKQDVFFLFVGKPMWKDKELDETYQRLKHKENIIFTGYLPSEEVSKILASSVALVFVSLFEGFGVPIVEALMLGVPVITSNTSAMPEVAGSAALYVDPLSIDEIAEAMKKLYTDKALRASLIENGKLQIKQFDWDRSAKRLWDSFQKAFNS